MSRRDARRLSRREAISAAAGGAALIATGLGAAAEPAGADQSQERIVASLQTILALELSAIEAYAALVGSGVVSGRTRNALRALRDADRLHAHRLRAALISLGVEPAPAPALGDIPGLSAATTQRAALAFATSLEQQQIGAYLASLHFVSHSELMRTLAGAIGADAQQLVVLRELAGLAPVPSAFENGTPP